MKTLTRIEKSAFRPGQYVGYCKYGAVRISRGGLGWHTHLKSEHSACYLTTRTLEEMNTKMERNA